MIHVCQLRFCCCVASRWGAKPMESYGLRHQLIRHWQFLGKTLPGWKTVPTFWRCQLLSGSVAPNLHPPLKDEKHGIFASLMDSANFNAMFFMPLLLPPASRIARNLRLPISPCSLSLSDLRFRFWRRQVRRMWVVNSCEAFQETRVLVCRMCAERVQIWCWFHPQIRCISRPRLPLEAPPELGSDDLPGWRIVCRSAAFIADPLPTGDLVFQWFMVGLWLVYGWFMIDETDERPWIRC